MSKKTKSEPADSSAILTHLERLSRLLRAASHAEGLTPAQWDALRFVAKANAFSNSPIALSQYVGATKGTSSQTVAQLVEKELIIKTNRKSDARSVALSLSEKGVALIKADPLRGLEKAIGKLGDKTQKRFAKGLAELLQSEHRRQKQPSFGSCNDCRYCRQSPNHCMKFVTDLETEDLFKFCVEHVQR